MSEKSKKIFDALFLCGVLMGTALLLIGMFTGVLVIKLPTDSSRVQLFDGSWGEATDLNGIKLEIPSNVFAVLAAFLALFGLILLIIDGFHRVILGRGNRLLGFIGAIMAILGALLILISALVLVGGVWNALEDATGIDKDVFKKNDIFVRIGAGAILSLIGAVAGAVSGGLSALRIHK